MATPRAIIDFLTQPQYGWSVFRKERDRTALVNSHARHAVIVPTHGNLSYAEVTTIMSAAGIPIAEYEHLL